jgi:hypothetical protein
MITAIELAFQAQLGHLYEIYVTNASSVKNQQEFTKAGVENAIAAYDLAMKAIEEWNR